MVDDLEERLSRYRADLDAAVAADLVRRHRKAGFDDADPLLFDIDHAIRLEPTMSTRSERRRVVLVATLGVAAAVIAVAVVATRDDDATPADEPSPTVTVPPTVPPQALPNDFAPLAPGTYYFDEVDGTPTPRIFATIGTGWWGRSDDEWESLVKRAATDKEFDEMTFDESLQGDVGAITVRHPDAVLLDACHWSGLSYHPGPVTTLDGLVAALTEQQGWADVTTPTDISIDGYAGKAFQRTAPADMSDCDKLKIFPRVQQHPGTYPVFVSWMVKPDELDLLSGSGPYEPGQIETLWVIDLDGTPVVISTTAWPEPSAGAPPDFAADVLDSIRIEQPSPTVPPQPLPNDFGPLAPGTYYVDEVSGTPTPRIYATTGTGWWGRSHDLGGNFFKRATATDFDEMTFDEKQQLEIGSMTFSRPAAVLLDACHMNDLSYHPGPVTTLDGLVAALTEQQGWADVTTPTDISIDGYAGKAFQRTAPADISDCDTMPNTMPSYLPRVKRGSSPYPIFVSWLNEPDLELDRFSGSGPYEPGEIETLWVIDIDGTLVVISTRALPEPSAGAPADFAADVLDSIRIERP